MIVADVRINTRSMSETQPTPPEKHVTRCPRDYLWVTLRGRGMGAADVVPGVSGGTVAFITGIYEELLDSIRAFGGEGIRCL